MAIKIKAGTSFVIPVTIEDPGFGNIAAIEFVFTQKRGGESLKTAYWTPDGQSRDAELSEDSDNTILVHWNRAETYLFKQNAGFCMDVRIHYTESSDNPFTKIVDLFMNETLFANGEEVGP